MTLNQIQYQQHLETRRANLEKEEQGRTGLRETQRHNVEAEAAQQRQIDVNQRHYNNQDAIASSNLAELIAHNRATEGEANRHNVQQEAISREGYESATTQSLIGAAGRAKNPLLSGALLATAGIGTDQGYKVVDTTLSRSLTGLQHVVKGFQTFVERTSKPTVYYDAIQSGNPNYQRINGRKSK